jgi:Protein of unknown function (DUF1488)
MLAKWRSWRRLIKRFRRRRATKRLEREGISMDLTFPNESRSYDVTRDAVRFWGYVSSIECSFFMTADALRRVEPELGQDKASLLHAFDAHRELIYKTAAKVFARGRRGSYELVPTDF